MLPPLDAYRISFRIPPYARQCNNTAEWPDCIAFKGQTIPAQLGPKAYQYYRPATGRRMPGTPRHRREIGRHRHWASSRAYATVTRGHWLQLEATEGPSAEGISPHNKLPPQFLGAIGERPPPPRFIVRRRGRTFRTAAVTRSLRLVTSYRIAATQPQSLATTQIQ